MSRFTCGQPVYMYIHLQAHSLVSFISSGRTPWHCVDSPTSDGLAHDRRKDLGEAYRVVRKCRIGRLVVGPQTLHERPRQAVLSTDAAR